MADGPTTRIEDIIVPEVFGPYVQKLTMELSNVIASGIVARSGDLDNKLAGGGLTFTAPRFRDLDNDAERISTDTSVPFDHPDANLPSGVARPPTPHKIGTFQEVAVRINRNQSWSSTDLAADLAGAQPMVAIGGRVAAYWTRRLQLLLINTMKGILADNIANDSNDYMFDVSGSSFSEGVTNFTAESVLDAQQTMGDAQASLAGIMMHSVVYNRAKKNNLIDFIPDSNGVVNIPTFLGLRVVVDDGLTPAAGHVYDSWLFRSGAFSFGVGNPGTPVETDRKPGGGNGGGQDVLYSRVQWCLHPEGHAFELTSSTGLADGGPTDAQLRSAATWNRAYPERKMVPLAVLRTREA